MPRRPLLGPLGVRLASAFLLVAMAAVAVFATLMMISTRSEVSDLTDRQRADDLAAAAVAAGESYERAGSWADADLAGAVAVAARSQATLTIVDANGEVVGAPTDVLASMMMEMHDMTNVDVPRSDAVSAPVAVDGQPVGAVLLAFPVQAMEAERHVRDALARTAIVGVVAAAVVALVVALYVSVRVTRPIAALTTAAGDLAAGRRDTRVETDGPGELRTLAEAFNAMADHLDTEDRLRRNLVADVAHELRTPLSILQGSTEALLDGVDRPTPEVLGSLNDEVGRLRRLVGDLETLAAAEAVTLRRRADLVDLAAVARSAVDLLSPLADDRSTEMRIEAESAPVTGDADRLHQVALNLIANALKFTPAGGTITVSTSSNGSVACLEVADNGPGIPEDELPHVFERFWRGTNRDAAGGSGIGLAVVAELIAAHHGTVSVENVSGGGARFTVTLPAAKYTAA
jgi:two-component system sensor histidine kinase BaeS